MSEAISALILAGGLGTRLQSVVADRAKPMAEVQGRPFVAFLLDQLVEAGIRHAVLCTGHFGETVRARLGNAHGPMVLEYSQEPARLDTAGALRLAAPRARSRVVLALNGDSYLPVDLSRFLAFQAQAPQDPALVLVRVPDTSAFGRVHLDAAGRVTAFEEKRAGGGEGWINGGIYALPVDLLRALPEGPLSVERDVFPQWTGRLRGFPTEGPLLDIGTPERYAIAAAWFAFRHASS